MFISFSKKQAVFLVLYQQSKYEFTAEEIGITEETLRHKGLSDGVSFATKKAIIQQGVLIRSARK